MKRYVGKVWEVPEHRRFSPHEVGVWLPSWYVDMFAYLEVPRIPMLLRFLKRLPHIGIPNLVAPYPAPLPSLEDRGRWD